MKCRRILLANAQIRERRLTLAWDVGAFCPIADRRGCGLVLNGLRWRRSPGPLAREDGDRPAGRGVPDARCAVIRRGDDARPVGAEGGGAHLARVAAEDGDRPAGRGVPDARCAVIRRGDDARPVGAEGGGIDPSPVAAEDGDRLVATSQTRAVLYTLARLSAGVENSTPKEELKEPAVSIRKSVRPEYLICLEDGKHFKSLKRHLAAHGLTPEQYRANRKLPSDYPMVAASYAASRSAMAKAIGLGQMDGNAGARRRGRPAGKRSRRRSR